MRPPSSGGSASDDEFLAAEREAAASEAEADVDVDEDSRAEVDQFYDNENGGQTESSAPTDAPTNDKKSNSPAPNAPLFSFRFGFFCPRK